MAQKFFVSIDQLEIAGSAPDVRRVAGHVERKCDTMEVVSLEVLCCVQVVRHGVAEERVERGVAVPVTVADTLEAVRAWAVGKQGEWCLGGVLVRQTPLILAAGEGSVEGLWFCWGELPAEDRREKGRWALAMAARKGRLLAVQWLMEHEADVRAHNDVALRWSAERGHLAVVQCLAEHGADVAAADNAALRWSAAHGHLPVVEWLVENGAGAVIGSKATTVLATSAADGHLSTVQWLVGQGADVNGGALGRSAFYGHLSVVQWLVGQGADVHAPSGGALRASARGAHLHVVQWLVEEGGADVHANDDEALRVSASLGNLAVVQWLVEESGTKWTRKMLEGALDRTRKGAVSVFLQEASRRRPLARKRKRE